MSDGPQWELSKENSAPLERGRNVKTLEKGLRKETTEENLENERRIQHFEHLLSMECDDPLIHWLSYIKFHQEAFPANTHDQFLLMERCTRALIGNNRFANDVRFIRVCVTYADKTQFPGDVFKFLHSHQVGNITALFWIAWAWVAENKGDYSFAEKVYLKGLAKDAVPLKLLQQRHKQFQRRMSRHCKTWYAAISIPRNWHTDCAKQTIYCRCDFRSHSIWFYQLYITLPKAA